MKILVACEESQEVCKAFRAKGHEAYSCDILECSGGHLEWHIRHDVLGLLNGNCEFDTCDGLHHKVDGKWDMIIAFPPCTHLAVSGARYFKKKREDGRQLMAVTFFLKMLNADCDKICVENPVGIMSGEYLFNYYDIPPIKPTQIIQPYYFGDPVRKKTCLWLKGLSPLQPTNMIEPDIIKANYKNKSTSFSGPAWYVTDENGKILSWKDPRTAQVRSKTYPGIAQAMAEQWG